MDDLVRDWSRAAADYARHRVGFPDFFFDELEARGWARRGMRALDLGTGTGTLAIGLASRGLAVTGLDPAPGQIEAARRAAAERGVAATFRVGSAEDTAEPDASADLVAAGQAWHWFRRERAAREALRVLAPGGRLLIATLDFLELPGSVGLASMDLVRARHAGPLGAPYGFGFWGLYPQWLVDLDAAGLEDVESFSRDLWVTYTHEAWRGRMRASAWVSTVLPPEGVASYDAELAAILRDRFPDPMRVQHRVFAVSASRSTELELADRLRNKPARRGGGVARG